MDAHIDLSIQLTQPGDQPDVAASELATLHYALFASQDYIDTYGAPTRLEAAVGHRFIAHSAQVSEKGQWHARTGAFMELAAPALVVNSSTAMLHAIERGAGIGPVPTAILRLTSNLDRARRGTGRQPGANPG